MYNNPEIAAQMAETRSGVFLSHSINHSGTSLALRIYDLSSDRKSTRLNSSHLTDDVYKNPEIAAQMAKTRSGVFLSHSLDHLGTNLAM